MSAVELRKIHQFFGPTHILSGLSLRVESGDYVVLLGKSGCGKTTLLRLVAGLTGPTSGSILIGEQSVEGVAPRHRDVSMVFQGDTLYPHLTVRQSIAFGLRNRISGPEMAKRIEQAAELAGAEELLDRYPDGLSGGELRRGAIAKSIARRAAVRLMDEPLSALDAPVRHALQDDLLRWHSTFEGTTIHVTHDGQEAMRMADKIAVLEEGRIVQFAKPREIYQQPETTSVARAVGWPPMNFLSRETLFEDSVLTNFHWDGDMDVEVGVRAEAFSVLDPSVDLGDWRGLVVSGEVTRVTWIDGRCHVRVDLGAAVIEAALSQGCAFETGQSCRLGASSDQLHLFDVSTHQRIGSAGGG
jgi:ABC-type sugar transport system ATPase subunit